MRVRVLLKFAKILMLSRLRNTRRSFLSNGITNRPILIALIGSIMFRGSRLRNCYSFLSEGCRCESRGH